MNVNRVFALRSELIALVLIFATIALCIVSPIDQMVFSFIFVGGAYSIGMILAFLKRVSIANLIIIVASLELPIIIVARLEIGGTIILFCSLVVAMISLKYLIQAIRSSTNRVQRVNESRIPTPCVEW